MSAEQDAMYNLMNYDSFDTEIFASMPDEY